MSRIAWLASYPKSGNTWVRMVFRNLLNGGETPVDINAIGLRGLAHAANRRLFDNLVGYAASDLTFDEVDSIRPDFYRYAAATADGLVLCKVHDAYTRLPDGRALFPADATAGVVYVIRNPLDVCVSNAHHDGVNDYDAIAARMADAEWALSCSPRMLDSQLRQRLLTWSEHVLSWTGTQDVPVHVIRYEDMHAAPVATFAAAAAFVGIHADSEAVSRAVAFSSIEELQRQEQEHGFIDRVALGRPFFRKGKVGSWREALTAAQAARLIADHRDVMQRFGYLTDAGEPVY